MFNISGYLTCVALCQNQNFSKDRLVFYCGDSRELKHGAILYNEAEVFSLSITNPNGLPMLPFDWLIHSSLILASCYRILFLCRFSAIEK